MRTCEYWSLLKVLPLQNANRSFALTDPPPVPDPVRFMVPEVRCWVHVPERAPATPVNASVKLALMLTALAGGGGDGGDESDGGPVTSSLLTQEKKTSQARSSDPKR